MWRASALCRFFPGLPWIEEPERRTAIETCAMEAVCARCPVAVVCASYADRYGLSSGFWAGQERCGGAVRGGEAA